MTWEYWLSGYYLATLVIMWIGLGWECAEETDKKNKDKYLGYAFSSIMLCWLGVPMVLLLRFGGFLRNKLSKSKVQEEK